MKETDGAKRLVQEAKRAFFRDLIAEIPVGDERLAKGRDALLSDPVYYRLFERGFVMGMLFEHEREKDQ